MIKKHLILLVILGLFINACTPDENTNNQYQGTYIGNVDFYMNGIYGNTTSKTINLTTASTAGSFLMINSIFLSNTCNISGNNLDIPASTVGSASGIEIVEHGTGTFSGNTLTIEFYQDQVNSTTNAVVASGKWTGTLIKQ